MGEATCQPTTTKSSPSLRNGCGTSSPLATSRQAMSMSGQLSMFDLLTLPATASAISSPASVGGRSPCGLPAGPTTGPSGPAPAPASPSARQAKEAGLLTSGTFGRSGTISSESAVLQSSLASRLRARTASAGSTLYRLTWKDRAIQAAIQATSSAFDPPMLNAVAGAIVTVEAAMLASIADTNGRKALRKAMEASRPGALADALFRSSAYRTATVTVRRHDA